MAEQGLMQDKTDQNAGGASSEGVRVAAITGATRGVGRELAIGLARSGIAVAILGRDLAAGQAVAGQIADAGGQALAIAADVTDEHSMARAAAQAADALGVADALVCAAGTSLGKAPIHTQDLAGYRQCFDTNVLGIATALKAFLPAMIAQGRGRIVAIGGTYGHKGVAEQALYASSKWAVRGLIKSIAREVGQHGITANVIAPGGIEGEKLRGLFARSAERQGTTADAVMADFLKGAALGRLVDGDDILAALLHLLGPGGRNITGQDIVIDAGTVI